MIQIFQYDAMPEGSLAWWLGGVRGREGFWRHMACLFGKKQRGKEGLLYIIPKFTTFYIVYIYILGEGHIDGKKHCGEMC